MRAGRRLLPLVVLLGALAAGAAALAGTVSWGSAIEVPGMAALNAGGQARVDSISCASAGECAASGVYEAGQADSYDYHAFVVPEQGGVWGSAIDVPGLGPIPPSEETFNSVFVSCGSPGNCAAGGSYTDGAEGYGVNAFVVDETNGVWGNATEVPGIEFLNAGDDAGVTSVSCGSAGNCTAVGFYAAGEDKYGDPIDYRTFAVSESDGTWNAAFQVGHVAPHLFESSVVPVSCAGTGDCVVGGDYVTDTHAAGINEHAFLTVERNGSWRKGMPVPGLTALSAGGDSAVEGVSCASAGNCTAVGWYRHGSHGRFNKFVVVDTNGKWGNARTLPGFAALNAVHQPVVTSIACAAVGNCAIVGSYTDRAHKTQAFVKSETDGAWRNAIEVPGLGALNVGGLAEVNSLSCASAGNCAATGDYAGGSGKAQAFVVAEQNGVWGTAVKVPGTATLGGTAAGISVSCAMAGACAIGGTYVDGSGHRQAFVTSP